MRIALGQMRGTMPPSGDGCEHTASIAAGRALETSSFGITSSRSGPDADIGPYTDERASAQGLGGRHVGVAEIAAQERDNELVADGREAVGLTVGIPKRQTAKPDQPRDALDDLMDGLDSLEL